MGTRSTISILKEAGDVEKIYGHWDGYLEGNGNTLLNFYNDTDKVKELIALGSVSSLHEAVAPNEGGEHSFENPVEDVTVAYCRDRGEDLTINKHDDVRDYVKHGIFEEYDYLYIEALGKWFWLHDQPLELFVELTQSVIDKGEYDDETDTEVMQETVSLQTLLRKHKLENYVK